MTIYIVIQEGIYRHDVKGIFTSLEQAKSRAVECGEDQEDDGYHTYCVCPAEIDTPIDDVKTMAEYEGKRKHTWKRASTGIGSEKVPLPASETIGAWKDAPCPA